MYPVIEKRFDLKLLLKKLVDMKPAAQQKGLHILHLGSTCPVTLRGDEQRLQRILISSLAMPSSSLMRAVTISVEQGMIDHC